MSFQPILTGGGLAGWAALKRSLPAQQARLAASPEMQREAAYFREKIGSISTAEQLVADRRLLKTALEAFGLEADLPARAFIRKVLQDGTLRPDALANKLADKRYAQFSAAFGFGDFSVPRTKLSTFADQILTRQTQRQFEVAVGARDENMRLALDADRGLAELAARGGSETAKWFNILGNPPLRKVMEKALGLPSTIATLDIDRQLSVFRERARDVFGADSVSQFADPKRREDAIRNFLVRSPSAEQSVTSPALVILTQGGGMFRRL